MFSFNADKYDFWGIYETIKHFYPLGFRKNNEKFYNSYKGLWELKDLIEENSKGKSDLKVKWLDFESYLTEKLGKTIVGTTYGMAPSFSAYVEVERIRYDHFTRIKRVHFQISLTGDFYTLIGDDVSKLEIGEETIYVTNYLVISPFNEFADVFEKLSSEIEQRFKGYRFIPNFILSQEIEGLEVHYTDRKPGQVMTALFSDLIDLNLPTFGSPDYKLEIWLTEGANMKDGYQIIPKMN